MVPKIKKFLNNNKTLVKILSILLVILVIFLVIYKSMFYSNSESDLYGVRLRDIKENEFTKKEKDDINAKTSQLAGVKSSKISVKGRLIKVFVTFDDGLSSDDMKARFNDVLNSISEKVRGYYDITFYALQQKDGTENYPVIGYKHKTNAEISFDVF